MSWMESRALQLHPKMMGAGKVPEFGLGSIQHWVANIDALLCNPLEIVEKASKTGQWYQ